MPTACKRPCAHPRCTELVTSGRCPKHQKAKAQAYDDRRGTASSRGYGTRWTKYRAWFLEQNPCCGDRPHGFPQTGDSQCVTQGLSVMATVVDHVIPVTGPGDPSFYTPAAHQALCESCHNAKRQRESIATRTGGVH